MMADYVQHLLYSLFSKLWNNQKAYQPIRIHFAEKKKNKFRRWIVIGARLLELCSIVSNVFQYCIAILGSTCRWQYRQHIKIMAPNPYKLGKFLPGDLGSSGQFPFLQGNTIICLSATSPSRNRRGQLHRVADEFLLESPNLFQNSSDLIICLL